MARDSVSLGPTPSGEPCQQFGARDYDPTAARAEVARFRDLLVTLFPPPAGARYKIASCAHDAGTYYDLEIVFDDADEGAADYAYMVEAEAPEYWPENEPAPPSLPTVDFHS